MVCEEEAEDAEAEDAGEEARGTDLKTRTPHKVVGKKDGLVIHTIIGSKCHLQFQVQLMSPCHVLFLVSYRIRSISYQQQSPG